MKQSNEPYKIILLGDPHVGKSCLYEKILNVDPSMNPDPTIGANYQLLDLQIISKGKKIKRKIELWDTAGQERYRSLVTINALGAIIVYDITKERSFRSITNWLMSVKSKVDTPISIMLVGNKLDLADEDADARRVEYSKVLEFQKNNNIFGFEETSAKYSYNKIIPILEKLIIEIDRKLIEEKNKPVKSNRLDDDWSRRNSIERY